MSRQTTSVCGEREREGRERERRGEKRERERERERERRRVFFDYMCFLIKGHRRSYILKLQGYSRHVYMNMDLTVEFE